MYLHGTYLYLYHVNSIYINCEFLWNGFCSFYGFKEKDQCVRPGFQYKAERRRDCLKTQSDFVVSRSSLRLASVEMDPAEQSGDDSFLYRILCCLLVRGARRAEMSIVGRAALLALAACSSPLFTHGASHDAHHCRGTSSINLWNNHTASSLLRLALVETGP